MVPDFFNLRILLWWMGGFLFIAWIALAVMASSFGEFAAMTIWAFGLCAVGASIGFLFGIPRVLAATSTSVTNEPIPSTESTVAALAAEVRRNRLAANTNLEQVSDWLTKILVGVGLVQFTKVPTEVNRLAGIMGPSFGNAPQNESVATGVILVFSVGGFLIGYITTRAFVPKILQDVEDAAVAVLEKRTQVRTLVTMLQPKTQVKALSLVDKQLDHEVDR